MRSQTRITVSHHLSTIKDSNQIYVFSEGKIVEFGTYSELMDKKGIFYDLEKGKKKKDEQNKDLK